MAHRTDPALTCLFPEMVAEQSGEGPATYVLVPRTLHGYILVLFIERKQLEHGREHTHTHTYTHTHACTHTHTLTCTHTHAHTHTHTHTRTRTHAHTCPCVGQACALDGSHRVQSKWWTHLVHGSTLCLLYKHGRMVAPDSNA